MLCIAIFLISAPKQGGKQSSEFRFGPEMQITFIWITKLQVELIIIIIIIN